MPFPFSSSGRHASRNKRKETMTCITEIRVGVLALQGAFEEHIDMLRSVPLTNAEGHRISVHAFAVRLPEQLEHADALVLPGGESTTIGKVATRWGLVRA